MLRGGTAFSIFFLPNCSFTLLLCQREEGSQFKKPSVHELTVCGLRNRACFRLVQAGALCRISQALVGVSAGRWSPLMLPLPSKTRDSWQHSVPSCCRTEATGPQRLLTAPCFVPFTHGGLLLQGPHDNVSAASSL